MDRKKSHPDDTSLIFANLMMQGNLNAVLKVLSKESECGVLELKEQL